MRSLWLDRDRYTSSDPFPADGSVDDVVVGAGLTGLATAVLLMRAGRSVVVLEARSIGAVTTGNSTAKVSLLQGTQLSSILANHSPKVARAYVQSNRSGQDWLMDYATGHGVAVERRDAFTYAGTPAGAATVRKELAACAVAGLDVTHETDLELPYPSHGAVRLADQAQLDPVAVLYALAAELRAGGGVLVEGVRVMGVKARGTSVVETTAGRLRAKTVVLATGVPMLDRGLYFAKVTAQRSYATAFEVPGPIPSGMYLSVDSPSRSLRTATHAGTELLLVGGNGHGVGREPHPRACLDDLASWTTRHFTGAVLTHTWSAQDYVSHNHVPFVGKLPRGLGHVYVATGYSKWGLTNAPAAALTISAQILGEPAQPWAKILGRRVSSPVTAMHGVLANAAVGAQATLGWTKAVLHPLDDENDSPAEGHGVVGVHGAKPVAVSTVDGRTCAVSAVCPHLGGVVSWNDADRSWDCPLHGSRFSADGTVLEGPAVADLATQDWPGRV